MNTACRPFQKLLDLEASAGLSAREFAQLDRHRESCPECAERFRTADSLHLFQRLADDSRKPEFWSGWDLGLRTAMQEEGRLSLAESFRLLRPVYRVGMAAVVVLVAGVVALIVPPVLDVPAPAEIRLGAIAAPGGQTLEPTVEMIRSPKATVYEMKVFGDGDQVTQLVMIFDEGIEL